jgi:hypothetical protein
MKAIVLTALLGQAVQGHYIFSQLIVNGAAQGQDYTYIRKNTNTCKGWLRSFNSFLSDYGSHRYALIHFRDCQL